MSAHVLLNLLNQIGIDKTTAFAEHFIAFRKKFNKFYSIGAQMLDSIHYLTKSFFEIEFYPETSRICHISLH